MVRKIKKYKCSLFVRLFISQLTGTKTTTSKMVLLINKPIRTDAYGNFHTMRVFAEKKKHLKILQCDDYGSCRSSVLPIFFTIKKFGEIGGFCDTCEMGYFWREITTFLAF